MSWRPKQPEWVAIADDFDGFLQRIGFGPEGPLRWAYDRTVDRKKVERFVRKSMSIEHHYANEPLVRWSASGFAGERRVGFTWDAENAVLDLKRALWEAHESEAPEESFAALVDAWRI